MSVMVGCNIMLTLWLCSGQIDPKKIFFFPKILVNVIALDSNLLTLCHIGYKYFSLYFLEFSYFCGFYFT